MSVDAAARPPSDAASGVVRLTTGVVVAILAVALVPFRAAGVWPGGGYADVATLGDRLARGLVGYWSSGAAVVGPALADPVSFWARFHVIKAALAMILLVVAIRLGVRLWRGYVGSTGRRRRLGFAVAAVLEAPVVLLALLVVVANLQGALAPLSSALGLLPLGTADPHLAPTLDQIRAGLDPSGRGSTSLPLAHLVDDFASYHVVMAWLGAAVTCLLVATVVWLWRRAGATPRDHRRVRRTVRLAAVACLALAAAFAVVTAANVSTVANPRPALLGFFDGGA